MMGVDQNNDGIGEPVTTYRKPDVGKKYPFVVPQTSDDFAHPELGLQWQWQAAPDKSWYSLHPEKGFIRVNTISVPSENGQLWFAGNLLLQKVPVPSFTVETHLKFNAASTGERAGLTVMGNYHTSICLERKDEGYRIILYEGKRGRHIYLPPTELAGVNIGSSEAWFRVHIFDDATCSYEYSLDGKTYKKLGDRYKMSPGTWIGGKGAYFALIRAWWKMKGTLISTIFISSKISIFTVTF